MAWTVERLQRDFDLTARDALLIIGIARGRIDPLDYEGHRRFAGCDLGMYRYLDGSGNRIEKKMRAIDHLLGTFGVEALDVPEGADADCPYGYFDGIIAIYCNVGDTYATTIAYDVARMTFTITTVCDLVEKFEANNQPDYSGESFAMVDHGGL